MYASHTGTKRNLDALRQHGWRLLLSAKGHGVKPEGFSYAIDNGAWWAYQNGKAFDVGAFERIVDRYGDGADWVAAPDIVGGGRASLELSLSWLPRLTGLRLIPVQDGMTIEMVRSYIGGSVGLFLGGTTEFKISTMRAWGALARQAYCYYHVGRVNTVRRIRMCVESGAHSCDGTSASRFSKNVPMLTAASKQCGFVWEGQGELDL